MDTDISMPCEFHIINYFFPFFNHFKSGHFFSIWILKTVVGCAKEMNVHVFWIMIKMVMSEWEKLLT